MQEKLLMIISLLIMIRMGTNQHNSRACLSSGTVEEVFVQDELSTMKQNCEVVKNGKLIFRYTRSLKIIQSSID